MSKAYEIWFEDLNEDTKDEVLQFYEISTFKDLNFDTQPIFILEREEDESEDI